MSKFCIIFFLCLFSITDITGELMVGQGESANLECAVDANPLDESSLRWVGRPGYDMGARTKTTLGAVDPTGKDPNRRSLMLTVVNATAADSGKFWCVADNGIGHVQVRNATFLLVRRKFSTFSSHSNFIKCRDQFSGHGFSGNKYLHLVIFQTNPHSTDPP